MAEQCRGITTRGGQCQLTVRGSAYCRYHRAQGENPPECQEEEQPRRTTPARGNAPAAPIRRNVVPIQPIQQPTITPRRITGRQLQFAPINNTPFQTSPEIRQLTEEQETLTDVPILEEGEEGEQVNIGLFEEEAFPEEQEEIGLGEEEEELEDLRYLEELLSVPVEEYMEASYDELYRLLEIFGFNEAFLPPRKPPRRQIEEDRNILLTLLDQYIAGSIDEEVLTQHGRISYQHAQDFLYNQPAEEEVEEEAEFEEEGGHEHEHPHEEEGADCCICMDEKVPGGNLLACKHAVCIPCLKQLTKAECPVCRAKLAGPTVTPDILQRTGQRETQDRLAEENANLLVALALQADPNADPVALYDRFYRAR